VFKEVIAWGLGYDKVYEVGRTRESEVEGFVEKRILWNFIVDRGTWGELRSKITYRLHPSLGTV